jgi:hypothetical protein
LIGLGKLELWKTESSWMWDIQVAGQIHGPTGDALKCDIYHPLSSFVQPFLRATFTYSLFLVLQFLCASMAPSMLLMGPDPTAMSYGHQQQLLQQCQVHNLQSVGSSDLDQFRALDSAFEASLPRTMTTAVCTPLSCLDAFADNLWQVNATSQKPPTLGGCTILLSVVMIQECKKLSEVDSFFNFV